MFMKLLFYRCTSWDPNSAAFSSLPQTYLYSLGFAWANLYACAYETQGIWIGTIAVLSFRYL